MNRAIAIIGTVIVLFLFSLTLPSHPGGGSGIGVVLIIVGGLFTYQWAKEEDEKVARRKDRPWER